MMKRDRVPEITSRGFYRFYEQVGSERGRNLGRGNIEGRGGGREGGVSRLESHVIHALGPHPGDMGGREGEREGGRD